VEGGVVGGLVPSGLTAEAAHTGAQSYLLGKAYWLDVVLSEPSTLSRAFSIPANLHVPTLAFTYRFYSMEGQRQGTFDVLVNDGAATTTLGSLTTAAEWDRAWFDLQPWAGQTVTVTLQISGTVADWLAWAFVDEYVLGSWDTPRLEALSPPDVPDLDILPLTLTVTGENFIATPTVRLGSVALEPESVLWIDESTLEVGVPAGLSVGTYDLWVVNPGGAAAAWPGALKVGHFAYVPLLTSGP
jgi:hypothetical protein